MFITGEKMEAMSRALMTFNAAPVTAKAGSGVDTFAAGELFLRDIRAERDPQGGWGEWKKPQGQCVRRGGVALGTLYPSAIWPDWIELTVIVISDTAMPPT